MASREKVNVEEVEVEEGGYCPLLKGSCLRERCAWWDRDEDQCSVASIAYHLSVLSMRGEV